MNNTRIREVEVKAKIKDLEHVIQRLEDIGCVLSEPIKQEDIIFIDDTNSFPQIKPGDSALRIRKQQGKYIFTYKKAMQNELDCIEKELEISSSETMQEILLLLNYHETVRVTKMRRKGSYREYEICIDTIENLGDFIEVEKMTDGVESEMVQEELFTFLSSLGVKKEDRVTQGYDVLLHNKQHGKHTN